MAHWFKVEENLTENEMKQVCKRIEGELEYNYFMKHSTEVLNSNNPHVLLGFPLKTLIALTEKKSTVYNRIRYYLKGEFLPDDTYDDVLKVVLMIDNWEKVRLLHVALIIHYVTFAVFSSNPVAICFESDKKTYNCLLLRDDKIATVIVLPKDMIKIKCKYTGTFQIIKNNVIYPAYFVNGEVIINS